MTLEDYEDLQALIIGVVLSFIVPTRQRTCGYSCPKCIFRLQNNKRSPRDFSGTQITPDWIDDMIGDYFEKMVHENGIPIAQFSIQGLNPFFDDLSKECSKRILQWSNCAPVAYVSSGDGVRDCIEAIADAHATSYISIDSGPKKNPILRPAVLPDGTPDRSRNSYDIAIDALRALCEVPKQRDRTYVACTLMPKQTQHAIDLVETLPDDLCEHVQVVFSPYISVSTGHIGIRKSEFLHAAEQLIPIAQKKGVHPWFDDEDNDYSLIPDKDVPEKNILPRAYGFNTVRVYPNGKVQTGTLGGIRHPIDLVSYTLENMPEQKVPFINQLL